MKRRKTGASSVEDDMAMVSFRLSTETASRVACLAFITNCKIKDVYTKAVEELVAKHKDTIDTVLKMQRNLAPKGEV